MCGGRERPFHLPTSFEEGPSPQRKVSRSFRPPGSETLQAPFSAGVSLLVTATFRGLAASRIGIVSVRTPAV